MTALTSQAAHAAVGCSIDYKITSSWQGGFQGDVTIKNTGDALSSWTLGWSFANGQKITQLWNGSLSQSGAAVTVKNLSYNGSVPSGGSTNFGFLGNWSGSNAVPTSFTLNGSTCGGGTPTPTTTTPSPSTTTPTPPVNQAPTVTLTSPAAGAVYTTTPATIPLSSSPVDSDGTITKVEYYSDTTLIATATASPWSATWSNVAAGSYSITAKAYDNQGATGTSSPAGITVSSTPVIKTSPATLNVALGKSTSFTVALSSAPTSNVTVTTTRTTGTTNLTVTAGASLTFTSANWNTPQTVTITSGTGTTAGTATFTSSAAGYTSGSVAVTETTSTVGDYDQRFETMYAKIHDSANGYFSPLGVPYHSIETLMVEAPDQGHETTSEAFSYWMWIEATHGRITGDWTGYNNAWAIAEKYIIPPHADQPNNSGYNASSPATYAPESDSQSDYPAKLDKNVSVGKDPIAAELNSAYGTADVYAMHWIIDVDNVYGFGHCGDGTTKPAYINTYQRGSSESVWETIPQPSCDTFKFGGPNGYLDLFTGDSSYAKQWKYTDAPDADARAVQAAYWADKWATAQGKQSSVSASVAKAAKMGDYLRYSMFDKYFKKIGNCTSPTSCAAGTAKDSEHYLISWYYAWGGSLDTSNGWAWRIGDGASHQGYQNPIAAYALSQVADLKPKSATGSADWATSLTRQLEFYQWLQSSDGAIAGGATNSWSGAYATPPAGTSTFYGMAYDPQPVWHDPPSNRWFGFQTWSMERVAEYYYATGNATAKKVLDKWVAWVLKNSSVTGGTISIPSDLSWSGQPDTWNASSPGSNASLHVTVQNYTNDIGVSGSLAKTLTYYAAKSGDTASKAFAKGLLDSIWANNQDAKGVSIPETRTDYSRFNDPVYVPSSYSGKMPNGDAIKSGATFLSIRSFYKTDPDFPKVQAYLNGGSAPVFNYHRFWAQSDVATGMAVFGELFPNG